MRRWPFVAAAIFAATPALGGPTTEDASGRRAIRGHTVETARESEELKLLREFEEESFPRSYPGLPSPILMAGVGETDIPPPPPARPSAESPPAGLRSPAQSPSTSPAEGPTTATAIPWLAGLKLPDMPVRFDPRVVRYLEFYKNDKRGRAIMTSWLRAQGRYRPLIEDALRRARLPHALLYVAMIESGYDPQDRSSAGAVGVWQFMREGGRIYGLRIDHWVDERRDPEKSTEAVMRYFADLQARFGSWHLALAAFNAGYGGVLRAIAKYNTNDYWELCRWEDGLPWETTLYVPKALAAAIVGENREVFGYDQVPADPPIDFDRVAVSSSTSLATLARAAGATVEQVSALNPELRRGRTPPEVWQAKLPRGTGAKFLAAFDKHREKLRPHTVRFGERIDEIAHAVGASAPELRRLNGIKDASEVRPGLTLVVPEGRKPIPPPADDEPVLVAVPDKDATVAGARRVFYRVLPGDGLKDIARFFRVAPADLARWNHIDAEAELTSRMVLQVWVAPSFDSERAALLDPARVYLVSVGSPEFFDIVEARRGRKRLTYKVRAGDTLKRIGARFNLTEGDLERINRLGRKNDLPVGRELTVYVPMSTAEKAEADKQWKAVLEERLAAAEGKDKVGPVEAVAKQPAAVSAVEEKAAAPKLAAKEEAAPPAAPSEKAPAPPEKPAAADAEKAPTDGVLTNKAGDDAEDEPDVLPGKAGTSPSTDEPPERIAPPPSTPPNRS